MTHARDLVLRGRRFAPGETALLAIINRTPDSFYDQGAFVEDGAALAAVRTAVANGADAVDIGGVRAGPGDDVDAAEEVRRVVPFIAAVREQHPDLVNDAWAGHDPEILAAAAAHGAGYVCAHTGGHPPRTDPHRVRYADVLADVLERTTALAESAVQAGVRADGILIDAAQDFGKNTYHSLAATGRVGELVGTGWPVLLAVSNKKFVAEALGLTGPKTDRVTGTLATTAVAAWEGVRVVRAHDVAATRQVLDMVAALRTGTPAQARRALA
jgi:dihydropteroate synthase